MIFRGKIISGTGSYLPPKVMTNADIAENAPTSAQWVSDKLGINTRHISEDPVAFMGFMAGYRAMLDADLERWDIDAVIVSCSSPSHFAPSMACQIIDRLLIKVPAFDINAVCSGFVYALEMACMMIDTGKDNVLVVATEKYSDITDWSSRDSVYFGDGAGAVVVSRGKGIISTKLYADGLSKTAFIALAGHKYSIDGKQVYKKAIEVLPQAIFDALKERSMILDEIDLIVPHQAGIGVVKDLMAKIEYPMEKCVTVMDKYANIASASIPIALDEVWKSPDVNNILLVTIGSGWTWGTAIIER